jgi:plasmid stabilization system protein ParE
LRTLRPASEELSAAVGWYQSQQPGLGADFYDAVVRAVDRVQEHPEIGTPASLDQQTRRVLVARFPYQIVYRVRPDEIVIVAVAHLRRRPEYWKDRT